MFLLKYVVYKNKLVLVNLLVNLISLFFVTILRIISLITGMMRIEVSKEQLLELNEKLNQIAVK